MSKVAIIGGGPAGMLAAASAAYSGHDVTLYERNEKLGKKLYLTGKGRCNITNSADMDEFFASIPRNSKFLYSAFASFDNNAIVSLIESMGVPTKVERGGRVFPESDKSSDVIRALSEYLRKSGAKITMNARVREVERDEDNGEFVLCFDESSERYDAVVICTGGKSYSSTGSTGDGLRFAAHLGHTITDVKPSLIPLTVSEEWVKTLQGLSLRNVTLKAYKGKKCVYEELGEMMFAHFGVTGPLVLSGSSRIADDPTATRLEIDLKPGLTKEQLDKRLLRDFTANARKQFKNSLGDLLPSKLIAVIIALSGIDPEKPVDSVTREEREALCKCLKCVTLNVTGTMPIDEAIITRGGVSVKEVNASTMESKLVPGLYFAGEVLDVDGFTGGFNLQIAYSTAVLAGRSIE